MPPQSFGGVLQTACKHEPSESSFHNLGVSHNPSNPSNLGTVLVRLVSIRPQTGVVSPLLRSKSKTAFRSNSLGFCWRSRCTLVLHRPQQEHAGSGEWTQQKDSPPTAQNIVSGILWECQGSSSPTVPFCC
jgi:hypothetical protein